MPASGKGLRPEQAEGLVIVVESQALLRESLAYLLRNSLGGVKVEAYGGIREVQRCPASLVIIGPSLAESGPELLRGLIAAVRQVCGRAPIGAIMRANDRYRLKGLQSAGLIGIVEDDSGADIVVAAVRLMIAGTTIFPRAPAALNRSSGLVASLAESPDISHGRTDPAFRPERGLTRREREILDRLRQGRRNKTIAVDLGISESTVKVHVRNILKKLHISNRRQVSSGILEAADVKESPV